MNLSEKRAVDAASAFLSQQKGLDVSGINVQSVTAQNWPDASLGCPEPGMMYAQVITPGYAVRLEAGGQSYEIHTSKGGRAVLCNG